MSKLTDSLNEKESIKKTEQSEGQVERVVIMCFCPECREEQFEVTIEDSGKSHNGEIEIHWFAGAGKCVECGYEGYYSDSTA